MAHVHLSSRAPRRGSITFVLIGRATKCRSDLLKFGAALLLIAGVPVLIVNGIYLFSFGSAEGSYGDIGGAGLMLLGLSALLITSLTCSVGLPLARQTVPDNSSDNGSTGGRA